MGLCFSRRATVRKKQSRRLTNQSSSSAGNGGIGGSNRWSRIRSTKKEEPIIHERALAAAILLQQELQNSGAAAAVPFDRSTSLRYPNGGSAKRNQTLPRSSSSRARSLTDPLLHPQQLLNQVLLCVASYGQMYKTNSFVVYPCIVKMPDYVSRTTSIDGHIEDSPINKLELFTALLLCAYLTTKVLLYVASYGQMYKTNSFVVYPCIVKMPDYVSRTTSIDGHIEDSPIKKLELFTALFLCAYLTTKDVKLEGLETNHFVLVHGGGFGAWCWYKSIALLEEAGFKVTAIDLTGSGVHSFDTNSITSLSQYVKPLCDFLEKLADGEKVILVAHDFGGACLSYSMELYPSKISKAVFIAAAMLTSGQSTLDMFSQKTDSNDLMRQAQIFLYANGNSHPPTAIDLDKSLLRDLLFNQSPSKDVALASVSMRPIPFLPVLEKLCLSDAKYGTVRRFYIETPDDNAIPISVQESMISKSPPEKVFRLKGADHSPFFSKPQALHKLLVEISKIP